MEGSTVLVNIAAWVSILLVFGFALLQFLLTLEVPIGEYALGGMHRVLPAKMRFVSGFFSLLWVCVGLSYLQTTHEIPSVFNTSLANALLIVYTLFLAWAIIGNGFITKSKKEKYLMTPLAVIGFISSVFLL